MAGIKLGSLRISTGKERVSPHNSQLHTQDIKTFP